MFFWVLSDASNLGRLYIQKRDVYESYLLSEEFIHFISFIGVNVVYSVFTKLKTQWNYMVYFY